MPKLTGLQIPAATTAPRLTIFSHAQSGSGKLLQSAHLGFLALLGLSGTFLSAAPVLALPQGGQVGVGQAQINPVDANRLNIVQQSDRAVINWNSFSIGAPEWVDFQQPSSTSATLNRVTGNTRSDIAGRLTANGQIMLVNPNGILFTPTAQIDVTGLAATTLDIRDQDFMNGILRFQQVPGKSLATVENQGQITVKEGGFAALVAPGVVNSGAINARLGKVVLASGTQATLDFYGDGLVSLAVDPNLAEQVIGTNGQPLSALITNSGTVNADGGRVTLSAKAGAAVVDSVINMNGVIQARSVENRNGLIVLSGGDTGLVAVSGNLDASGTSPGQTGGTVQVLGKKVGLFDGTRINVSGDTGGGIALLGGDYKGQGTVANAEYTSVGRDVAIDANALTIGNGGKVIVWADAKTQFAGTITARGGALGGNGGFVETSGKGQLSILNGAMVNTAAPLGLKGTWLLDPTDLTVVATGGTGTISGGTNSQDDSTIDASTIVTALDGNNINLLATNSITVNAAIDARANTNPGDLTLTAPIANLNQPISLRSGSRLSGTAMTVNVGAGGIIQNGVDVATAGAIVNLAAGTFNVPGATDQVTIKRSLTVNGAGKENTFVDGGGNSRVFNIVGDTINPITVNLNGLTIQKGNASGNGGGILIASGSTVNVNNSSISDNEASISGGGIFLSNTSTLNISNSTIVRNKASGGDGGGIASNPGAGAQGTQRITLNNVTVSENIAYEAGGGIEHERGGVLEVINSTISGNKAQNADGGGIENDRSTLTVINSTISGNVVENPREDGGGIENDRGSVNIINSTISGNQAGSLGGGIDNKGGTLTVTNSTISGNKAGDGGGINNRDDLNNQNIVRAVGNSTVGNSIVAGNTATNPVTNEVAKLSKRTDNTLIPSTGSFASKGFNLVGQNGNTGGFPTINTDILLAGSIDTVIAPLANNGGFTQTHALVSGSPAIDAGSNELAVNPVTEQRLTTDQRGGERAPTGLNAGNRVDIGAYEATSSYLVTNTNDDTSFGSLRTGVSFANFNVNNNPANTANPAPNTVRFDQNGIFSSPQTITLRLGELALNNATTPIAIQGTGADNVTISGNNSSRVFNITAGDVTLNGLSIKDGSVSGNGGGIQNSGRTLTVINSTISNNTATNDGGGIFNSQGTLEVIDSLISDNKATNNGGGIANEGGTVTVTRGSISKNTATQDGGGISNAGTLTVSNSNILNNTAEVADGNGGGGGIYNQGMAKVTNGTIEQNRSDDKGGGIFNEGTLVVDAIPISYNTARNGGAIANGQGGMATVTKINIFKNTASDEGGGIFNSQGQLNVSEGTISDNKARDGGAISNEGGTVTVTKVNISANTASDDGGGVQNSQGGTFTIRYVEIYGNTAADNGGGIENESGTLEVFDSAIYKNKASGFGGGVYIQGGIAKLTSGSINDNTADQGGGIYNQGTTTVEKFSITGNTAETGDPNVFNTGTFITK